MPVRSFFYLTVTDKYIFLNNYRPGAVIQEQVESYLDLYHIFYFFIENYVKVEEGLMKKKHVKKDKKKRKDDNGISLSLKYLVYVVGISIVNFIDVVAKSEPFLSKIAAYMLIFIILLLVENRDNLKKSSVMKLLKKYQYAIISVIIVTTILVSHFLVIKEIKEIKEALTIFN
jgi:hypothetical protein